MGLSRPGTENYILKGSETIGKLFSSQSFKFLQQSFKLEESAYLRGQDGRSIGIAGFVAHFTAGNGIPGRVEGSGKLAGRGRGREVGRRVVRGTGEALLLRVHLKHLLGTNFCILVME